MKRTNQILLNFCLFLIAATSAFKVDKAPARVLVSQDRSVDDGYTVEIEANGETRKLRLTPLENIWSENAQAVVITSNENGEEVFERKNVPQDIKVYHDAEVGSVLSLSEGKVDGVIDGEYVIKLENDQHFVIKSSKKSADKFDFRVVPESLPEMVVKRSFIGRNDSVPIPIPLMNSDENRQTPTYSPEISFVVDSTLAAQIGPNDASVYTYLTIFCNCIKKKFSTIQSPIIAIKIVGCVIIRNTANEPFITNNIIPNSNGLKVNGDLVLSGFSSWVYSMSSTIPKYDVCYLSSGKDFTDSTGGNQGLAGIAYVGTVCVTASGTRSYAVGIGEDGGAYYDGCHTATHEIAHNLGSPHDNDTASGTGDCKWEDGYIMSYIGGVKNHCFFSNCSIKKMSENLSTTRSACVKTAITTTSPPGVFTSTQLPGDVLTMEAQCKKITGNSNAFVADVTPEDSLCCNLICQYILNPYIYTVWTYRGAAEGSLCPSAKKCSNCACV